MEGIGSKGERVGEEAGNDLKKEERRINGEHNLDTGRLGKRQLGHIGGVGALRQRGAITGL